MRTFGDTQRALARYRICLERDTDAGQFPARAYEVVDAFYTSLSTILESARVELEAAGPATQDEAFTTLFVGGCSQLGKQMHRATRHEHDPVKLRQTAVDLRTRARALMEHLWIRIERAAA